MNIGILTGYWSTNIGNSYFQLGAEWLLKNAFPNSKVFLVPDLHGYVYPSGRVPSNCYNPIVQMNLDVIVVLGPFITRNAIRILAPTLSMLSRKGVKVVGLSAGLMDYTISHCDIADFVNLCGFSNIFTRDECAYDRLREAKTSAMLYSGIDTAYFVSDAISVPKMVFEDCKPRLALVCDQIDEPQIATTIFDGAIRLEILGQVLYIKPTHFEHESKIKNFLIRYLRGYLSREIHPLESVDILRTDHRFNPYVQNKIFSLPRTFSSDVPYGYLQIYANSSAVISSRVHACAAALSYGVPAMLLSENKRGGLLERIGALQIQSGLVYPAETMLSNLKNEMMEQVKQRLMS